MNAALTRLRGRAGVIAALTTLMLGSTGAVPLAGASAARHSRSHHTTHRVTHHTRHHSSGIPQGAHAGDGDSDNHGGPSDGDGNL